MPKHNKWNKESENAYTGYYKDDPENPQALNLWITMEVNDGVQREYDNLTQEERKKAKKWAREHGYSPYTVNIQVDRPSGTENEIIETTDTIENARKKMRNFKKNHSPKDVITEVI